MNGTILTGDEMRAAEIAAPVTLAELMERAGKAVADAVWRYGGERPVLFLCGPGNNGGDGYVAARILKAQGLDVRVAALREPRADLAIAARGLWDGPIETIEAAPPAPVLVDALFGTGLQRPLEIQVATRLEALIKAARFSLAIDLPSGVGTDDGASLGAVQVDMTLALGSLKPAHLLQPAASLCGHVRVADIGITGESASRILVRPKLHVPDAGSHKYRRGMVAIVAGAMSGAALLSASAAMRLAGYVVMCGSAPGHGSLALVHRPWSEILRDDRVGAVLLGPGLGRDAEAKTLHAEAISSAHPLVLDADGVSLLAATEPNAGIDMLRKRTLPTILTPHGGEFSAVFGAGTGSKIDRTRAAAALSGATIIHKGADTVIASPDGRVIVASDAPGWLASAGTGDSLAGLVAALLSGGMAPLAAAEAAVWLHGDAARRAGPGLIADDLSDHIPAALAACL
jgi:ADP-dependent NAD(P)H-hydrate dehydratase / NAD(P)H-hydrate epimerase